MWEETRLIEQVKQCLKKMLLNGELDDIIRYTKGKERREVIKLKKLLENAEHIENIPYVPLICNIESTLVLQSIIMYLSTR